MKNRTPLISAALFAMLLTGCSKHSSSATVTSPTATTQQTPAISKSQVQAVFDSIDKAFVKKDAAAVTANYASNAVITATIVEGGRTTKTKDVRDDYQKTLEAGFAGFTDYSLQRKDVTIEIAPDSKTAQCVSTVVEKFRLDGKQEEAVTKESVTFAMLDDKVLVTDDHSDTTIK
jgi:hypothetical protein